MSSAHLVTLGKLRLVAGESWESPANMLLRAPSRRLTSPREVLCVLVALRGSPLTCEPLEGAIAAALADELFRAPGSVTARLRRGIEAANGLLCSENDRSYAKAKRYGGVVCLLLRSDEAYLGQVGAPRAYVCQGRNLRSYAPRESAPLLGQETAEASLWRVPLTGDTRILLTDRQWEEPALEEALPEPDARDAWESIAALAPPADSSAWLIGPPLEAAGMGEQETVVPAQARQMMQVVQPMPQARLRQTVASRWPRLGPATGHVWRWIRRAGGEIREGLLPRPISVPPEWRSEEVGPTLSSRLQPYLLPIAVSIPLLVLLLTALLYWQTQTAGNAEFTSYLRQAQTALSIADQPHISEAAARVYLQSAVSQIDAALALRPARKDAEKLREEVQRQLDLLNHVTRLAFIRSLYDYPLESQPGRVFEVQDATYVLDRYRNRVYRHQLDESSGPVSIEVTEVVIQEGQEVAGRRVSALADMTWSPADGTELLLVLDQQGIVWAYTPGTGVRALTLPGLEIVASTGWRLATYEGRLYVLAPEQGQVLRYARAAGGFGPPEEYFALGVKPDLSGVTDMAIDGYVYLLSEKGLLQRFLVGQEEPLPIALPDEPLGRTLGLFARPDEEAAYLYVLDAERGRVLQLSKKGELIRQLRPRDPALFANLGGISVDEARGRLLVTDGNRLLLAEVPPLVTSQ